MPTGAGAGRVGHVLRRAAAKTSQSLRALGSDGAAQAQGSPGLSRLLIVFSPTFVRIWLDRLRDSFWFLPGLLAGAAAFLGAVMPYVDGILQSKDSTPGPTMLLYDIGPAGARSVLTATASSSITVAATVFSITIATLTLTSSQFGPRLLRTFTTDRGVQFSLGTFIATFIYPLLVLRVVQTAGDSEEAKAFVPHLSVFLATVMALFATGVLIYFVHHVALIIRAPQVIAEVGNELDDVIDHVIPVDGSRGDQDAPDPPGVPGLRSTSSERPDDAVVVARSGRSGFITVVGYDGLLGLAGKIDAALWLTAKPGDYVFENAPLASAAADVAQRISDADAKKVAAHFGIAARRTVGQDPIFAIEQLTEIAQRALSPGINDPHTAINCIDRLGAALARACARPFPDQRRRDATGILRVVSNRLEWPTLVAAAFDPIRRYGKGDANVMGRLLDTIAALVDACPRQDRRRVLREHADAILATTTAPDSTLDTRDRQQVQAAYAKVLDRLKE